MAMRGSLGLRAIRQRLSTPVLLGLGTLLGSIALYAVVQTLDRDAFVDAGRQAWQRPDEVALALVAFASAFLLRALAWRRVLPELSLSQALAGIHLALGANHLLPFRMGEPLRVLSVVRRTPVGLEAATASTVTLRAVDLVAVVALGLASAPTVYLGLVGWGVLVVGVVLGAAAVGGWWWLRSIAALRPEVRLPGLLAVGASVLAWPAEAILVWQVAGWAGLELSFAEVLVVTTVSVAAQVVAVAPGGFGTYEAAGVAAYVALGHDPETALVAALGAHGLKTVYSLLAGALAVAVPGPGLLGRFRLVRDGARPGGRHGSEASNREGPVLLFMPAHNEEAAVVDCVDRCPAHVAGREVQVLVIDDGSTDATVARARGAGAEVLRLPENRGLGAAVRVGLAEGVRRGASAVVFCDADGEYPPEELEAMVEPILAGRADYVTGSRFLGRIDHMRPHRRLGNRVLSLLLSIVARRRITDGQTGYRALSPNAAASAEIIHDFNYAQVLTLDLLAKGYVHTEVPISYHFRTTGDSFIKLGPYLRKVVPAVYRELNTA